MTTTAAPTKPPAPLLTRVVQLLGIVAFAAAGIVYGDVADGCDGLECLAGIIAVYLVVWGSVALLAGLRNRLGLVCLILAVLVLFLGSWVDAVYGVAVLAVLALLTRLSKDRLKSYYLPRGEP